MVTDLRERGTEGINEFAGHISAPYLDKLRWPGVYTIYDEMRRRDPTLRAILLAIRLMARRASWTVEAAGETQADKEAAEFLRSCLGDMSHTVEDFLDDVLTMLPFGWASFEIVYKRRPDGLIGWQKFAFRRQSTLSRWQFDGNGGMIGWWQSAAPTYSEVFLPIEKLLHFVAERDGSNPEGLSLFESAYEPWHFVTNLQIINGIGWQRTFVGLPHFHFNEKPDDTDKAVVAEAGQGLRQGSRSYISTPPAVDFNLLSAQNSGAAALLDTIRMFRVMMTQIVLADFIWLGTGNSGSWSLGSDKSQLFLMAVNGYLDRISAVWNRFGVSRLFEAQPPGAFAGMTGLPRLHHTEVSKYKLSELGAFIAQIANHIPLHESDAGWIRDQAGMGLPSGEVLARSEQGAPGVWRYPEERDPVGMAEFAEPLVQAAPESELRAALLGYFQELRARIVEEIADEV